MAMFTDPAKWRKPVKDKFNLSLLQYPINEFTYRLIKLKSFRAEEFEKRIEENPLAAAYLPLTDYPGKERPLIKAKAMKGIAKIPMGLKQATLFSLVQESMPLEKEEEDLFQKLIQAEPIYQEVKMLQSIKEVGIEEGIEKGQNLASEAIAKNMLLSGKYAEQEIADLTGMHIERVNELAKGIKTEKNIH